ncbi:glutathione S-transferase protein [Ancylostoma caninum]|uniref:glutathione transferase n=1 Tax=Ancylostoma caninum TaxID=29170 RepID=A0A368GX59_ANCCA|nr:glutathione S-transferase protein [Ancylostoma caninum]
MPFEQIPVLEVDGKQLAQSYAICRFLARRYGYAGKTPFEEALVDSIADQIKDYMLEIRPFMVALLGIEEVDVETLKKDIFLPASAKLFRYMKKFLKDNTSGYLVGDSLTWADLYLAEHVAVYGEWFPEMLEGFPEIKSHSEKVRSNPALRQWIETRPETKF